jgi:hypothetical protein
LEQHDISYKKLTTCEDVNIGDKHKDKVDGDIYTVRAITLGSYSNGDKISIWVDYPKTTPFDVGELEDTCTKINSNEDPIQHKA